MRGASPGAAGVLACLKRDASGETRSSRLGAPASRRLPLGIAISLLALALAPALALALAVSPEPALARTAEPTPPAPGIYKLRAGASELTYEVKHPMHKVRGVTREVRGSFTIVAEAPWLQLPARLTAPLAAFSSRNRNRDSNALSVLGAARFPDTAVEIRRLKLVPGPGPAWEATGTAEGDVLLRGVSRPFEAEVTTRLGEAGAVLVQAVFGLSLAAHSVERPALLFVPIDDGVSITCKLVAEREK